MQALMHSLTHHLRAQAEGRRPLLIGISGIDGSGKGFVAQKLQVALQSRGWACAIIGIDGWLQPPSRRFNEEHPAEHFYRHGIRFGAFAETVVEPLRRDGSLNAWAKHCDPSNTEAMVDYHYDIVRPDVVLVEGIFLFGQAIAFNYRIWVECSYETALERALARNQEGLSPEALREDYHTIYFPAQELHLRLDRPRERADIVYLNDDRERAVGP